MPVAKRYVVLLTCVLAAVFCYADAGPFSAEAYLRHVRFLASDEMQGRGNGSPELNKAAEYIAGQFAAAAVQPGGDDGTFFQKFQIATGSRLGPRNMLTFVIGGKEITAAIGKDYVPFGAGEKTALSGDVVFAGYGISSEENKYDDYKDVDVTDKIVLVMAHEPRETDPNSPFNGAEPTLHGEDNTKAQNAKYRGGARNPRRTGPGQSRRPVQGLAGNRRRSADRRARDRKFSGIARSRAAVAGPPGEEPRGPAEADRRGHDSADLCAAGCAGSY